MEVAPELIKPKQRLDIQGLRAFALIIILIYHARIPLEGGFIALDIFFVISGFVITQMLMREREKTGRIDLKRFYTRRFKRLTPALAVTVSVVVLISIFLQSPFGAQQTTTATAIGTMLLTANAVIAYTTGDYFDAAAEQNPLLNMWSLSTEEQFYLVFPAIMVLAWFLATRVRWSKRTVLVSVVGGMGAVTFVLALLTSSHELDWPGSAFFGYYGAVGRAWEFAAGALLALFAVEISRMPRRVAEVVSALGLGVVVIGLFTIPNTMPYPGVATLVPVIGTAAMIAGGTAATTWVSRLMAIRPMVRIGDMSYSWYLWHWPVIVFAMLLWPSRPVIVPIIAVGFSFLPALLSYRFVEMPLRNSSDLSPRRLGALVAVCFGIPLLLAGFLALGAKQEWWLSWPRSYSFQEAASYRCHDQAIDPSRCTWPPGTSSAPDVFLLGDSQALSLSDGVIAADASARLSTFVSSRSQCPFIAPGYVRFDYPTSGCNEWQREALSAALEARPSVVVIANRPYVNGLTGGVTLTRSDGSLPLDSADAARTWQEALNGVVRPLRAAGIGVVIASTVPEPSYDAPTGGIAQLRRIRATQAEALARRAVTFEAESQVAAANPGTVLYDPLPVLCDEVNCPDARGDAYLYADPRHLSVAGALELVPTLSEAIAQARDQR
jgi:peptidoglycan/LPS O-acetylase OafA/YrhL